MLKNTGGRTRGQRRIKFEREGYFFSLGRRLGGSEGKNKKKKVPV